MLNTNAITIHFLPLLPMPLMIGLALLVCVLTAISIFMFKRGLVARILVSAIFLMILLNPSLLEEEREPMKDTAVIVIDKSTSQNFGNRSQVTTDTINDLSKKISDIDNVDVRIVESAGHSDTRLFETLDQAFSDIPVQRRAGAILITDGQVHDIPTDPQKQKSYGPIHALITGEEGEFDRQVKLTEAPSYGIVGQSITIRYIIFDTNTNAGKSATISIKKNGVPVHTRDVPINVEQSETLQIDHAGQNIFEIEASPIDGELTTVNNRAPVLVNGIRDRLKVLLISGKPYPGERTWRDLLTSDPGVDLVHFTILRQPDKIDITPQNELSLIAFPFRELFEVKLYDFDLIIFDQYSLNRILPTDYFDNIANYVQEGGALLEASGPSFIGSDSIYTTTLKDILPAAPTGTMLETPFKPKITDLGTRHPVTQGLSWGNDAHNKQAWGSWMRQIGVLPKHGDIIMSGAQESPLLILDHVGKGRVAQLASDQIWLWSHGFQGGGPQAELLRRLAHWLMKEPELEENALEIIPDGGNVIIRRRNLHNVPADVVLTLPDGSTQDLNLKPDKDGWLKGSNPAPMPGIYSADDGEQKRFAVLGDINPPEWQSVVSSTSKLKPITSLSGGTIHWISTEGTPDIRQINGNNRNFGGYGWIGLRDNNAYAVTGMRNTPLLPSWLSTLILIFCALSTWWAEGRTRKS